MQAAFYVAATILAAAAVGWLVTRSVRHIRSPVARWALSVFAGLAALLAGGIFLLDKGLLIPADDDSMFRQREAFEIGIYNSASSSSPAFRLIVEFPPSIRVKDDTVLDFSFEATGLSLPAGNYSAVLAGNRDMELRTMQPCPTLSQSGVGEIRVPSCGELRVSTMASSFAHSCFRSGG